jgi:hypothetical protein
MFAADLAEDLGVAGVSPKVDNFLEAYILYSVA